MTCIGSRKLQLAIEPSLVTRIDLNIHFRASPPLP